MSTCVYVCVNMWMCVSVRACVCMCVECVCMCVCVSECVCVCMCAIVCLGVCVRLCEYVSGFGRWLLWLTNVSANEDFETVLADHLRILDDDQSGWIQARPKYLNLE